MDIFELRKLDKKEFLLAFNNTINDEIKLLRTQIAKISQEFNKFFTVLIDKIPLKEGERE